MAIGYERPHGGPRRRRPGVHAYNGVALVEFEALVLAGRGPRVAQVCGVPGCNPLPRLLERCSMLCTGQVPEAGGAQGSLGVGSSCWRRAAVGRG